MIKDNKQKIKLLQLCELLHQESSPDHPLRTVEICGKLWDLGITCDRRTLSKDIKVLWEFEYDVHEKMMGHEKGCFAMAAIITRKMKMAVRSETKSIRSILTVII